MSYEEIPAMEQKIFQKWTIDPFLSIVLNLRGEKLRVRLVDSFRNATVEMTTPTFAEFVKKMEDFTPIYVSSSIICNNELAVFSSNGECILQEIFEHEAGGFNLKATFVKLNREQLVSVLETSLEIRDVIINTLLCDVLPNMVREKCTHVNDELSTEIFFKAVFDDLMTHVEKLHFCRGCVFDHPSQRRHDCIMDSPLLKYQLHGGRALCYLNCNDICKNLKFYNDNMLCEFKLNRKMYEDYFEKFID